MAIDKIVAEYRLELDGLRQDVNALKGQLKSVDDSVKQSTESTNQRINEVGNNIGGKLPESFKKLGAAIAAAFAVERITNFAVEAVNLAAKAEGIKRAFDKLNQPNLLDELRTATKGTVSDLQLMTTAVKASNFKLPLDQLAKLLKFAQQRAIETGESIDYLVESIVLGISRKSIPILDNLGISATEVQAEFAKTGDMAVAVGNIIDKSMTDAGEATLTMAERQAQLRVEFENIKEQIGESLIPIFESLIDITQEAMTNYGRLLDKLTGGSKLFNDEYDKTIKHATEHNMTLEEINKKIAFYLDKSMSSFGDEQKIYSARMQAYASLRDELEKSGQTQLNNNKTIEATNTATQAQIGLLEQLQQEIEALTELQKKSNDPAEIKKYTVEIEKLQKRIKELTTVTKSNAKTFGDLDKQTTDFVQTTGSANNSLVSLYIGLSDAQEAMASGDVVAYNKALEGMASIMVALADEDIPALKAALGELKDTNKTVTELSLEDWDMYSNALLSLFDSFNQAFNNSANYRLSVLDRELEQGIVSQETYDQKKRQILREEAQREKAFSLLSISLSTARAVMSALGTVPPNPALAILAGVTGAAQLAVAASAQIPAFEKGGLVKGGEQIIRINEKGEEYVVNARATSKHKDALEAINKDRFDDYVMKIYAKQIKDKQKDTAIGWDEYFYRQYLLQNKLISATEKQGDKVIEAVREMPKRHRFQ